MQQRGRSPCVRLFQTTVFPDLGTDLTVVFDAGQNSASNFTDLADTPWAGSGHYHRAITPPCSPSRPADADRWTRTGTPA